METLSSFSDSWLRALSLLTWLVDMLCSVKVIRKEVGTSIHTIQCNTKLKATIMTHNIRLRLAEPETEREAVVLRAAGRCMAHTPVLFAA